MQCAVAPAQFLHANSIIYCDIKPSNVLLDENGRLKLGGFGLSRRLSDINKTPIGSLPPVSAAAPATAGRVRGAASRQPCSDTQRPPHESLAATHTNTNNDTQAKRGTPCYMAPELFSEGATHSTASDLWSLGCVLYECATGRPPFMDSSFNQLVQDILNKEPEPVAGVCQRVCAFACMRLGSAVRRHMMHMACHAALCSAWCACYVRS
jgi:serine/threonine-protein kinase ULK4